MNKARLRTEYRAKRKAIGAEKRATWSSEIAHHALGFLKEYDLPVVGTYVSKNSEVDTLDLIRLVNSMGIKLVAPKIVGEELIFFPLNSSCIASTNDTEGCIEEEPYLGFINCMLTPVITFDLQGNRVGQGKGYFDRWFANSPETLRLGLAFHYQRCDTIPAEPHDVPLHGVITEQGLHKFTS